MKLMTLNMFIPHLLKFSEIIMKVNFVLLILSSFIYSAWCRNATDGLSDNFNNIDDTTIEETLESGDSSSVPTSSLDTAEDNVSTNETSETSLSDSENSTRSNKVSCSCNNTSEDNLEPRV